MRRILSRTQRCIKQMTRSRLAIRRVAMSAITLIVAFVFATGILGEPIEDSGNDCLGEPIEVSDYYWREYSGVIPTDALPGGIDASGYPTYIGQMFCEICQRNSPSTSTLLPATIRRGSKTAVGCAYDKVISSDYLVKILCTRHPHKYQWVATTNSNSHLLTQCQAVIGGTEVGYVLNIGRVYYGTETTIGKVFPSTRPISHGLAIAAGDKIVNFQTYELLTYNCNVPPFNMTITY